jgi:glutamine cyclotransferase
MIARRGLALVMLLGACSGRDDAGSEGPALPPGMLRAASSTNADAAPPQLPFDRATPRLVARALANWPHDTAAYTQGLLVHDGKVFEGTGLAGQSDVRQVELTTGAVVHRAALAAPMFGEGIAVHGDRLYQLTWQHQRGYVYNANTLAPVDSFTYTGEGWGLATDGKRLYLSDGTSNVRVIDPAGFREERTFQVREAGKAVWFLNELEWVAGELWANVYQTDLVARIDPADGHVKGWVDLSELLTPSEREAVRKRGGVANGIAVDSAHERLLVTGKKWPRVFAMPLPPTRN